MAKDIAHALSVVEPSHIAIDPNKLEAVNSALELLGWQGVSRPTVLTVLQRSGDLKLVGFLSPFSTATGLIRGSFPMISQAGRPSSLFRPSTWATGPRKRLRG